MMMALMALALMLAACGGGDAVAEVASLDADAAAEGETPSAPSDVSDDPADVEAAMMAFAACMRENGVDMDDPTVDADGNVQLSPPAGEGGGQDGGARGGPGGGGAMGGAFETCGEYLEGISLGFDRGDPTEMQDTMVEFAACIRDNGIDMADPDFSAMGGPPEAGDGDQPPQGGGLFGDVDMDDPDFQAAQDACSDILSGFGPGGGGFGGGGPGGPGAGNGGGGDA